MGFFSDRSGSKGKTGLETKCEAFNARYRSYPERERRATMRLLKAVFEITESSDFSNLAGDLMPFVLGLLPLIPLGNVGNQLVLAIEDSAPDLRREVSLALGANVWAARVENARRAMS